jgi:sugar/nucleoside kinase (ribokinase family)
MGTTKYLLLSVLAKYSIVAALMTTPNKPHIMCVGLATIDFVATVDHFPEPDEKMRSSTLIIEGGGNAANTACAMGRLSQFVDVTLVTGVGDDANGAQIVSSIQSDNVQVLAEKYPGNSPFSYIINTNVNGENTRTSIHQPASGDMSLKFVENVSLDDITAVHFDSRYPTAAVALARRCVDLGIPYSVDVERPREGLLELLQGATVVICNSNYCNTILGQPSTINKDEIDFRTSAHRLRSVMLEQAPNALIAVVTLGSKGSCLINLKDELRTEDQTSITSTSVDEMNGPTVSIQSNCLYCTAFPNVDVVDSTGAGDAFIGGFLTTLWVSAFSHQKGTNQ